MRIAVLSAAVILAGLSLPPEAEASTLTGDMVSIGMTADRDYGVVLTSVGSGPDATFFGNQVIDMNAGPEGDELRISSTTSFYGIDFGDREPVVWTFSDLDFSDGKVLIGFEFLRSFSNVVATITERSLVLTYADVAIPTGLYLAGRFITGYRDQPSNPPISPVPLPASLPLLLAGLAGLGTIARRRRRG